jgi:uncharacterized membrane protein YtjA (UPF0391 family)
MKGQSVVLYWSFIFFAAAMIAGLLGFWGITGASSGLAQAAFFLCLLAFIATLVMNDIQGRRPPV